ncbi:MAG: ATP-binding protein [Pseudomonadota bacterium]
MTAWFGDDAFQPHGYCLLWEPKLFWTHVVADTLIALSYFTVPVALVILAQRRPDIKYSWMLYCFGLFIVSCGMTHAFGVWTMWAPLYTLEAAAKVVTALVSIVVAVLVWPLLPAVVALPDRAQLEAKNRQLAGEIATRLAAESRLRALNGELERRVFERTRVLEETNAKLTEASRAAQASARAKADFLATMSHEIRTPMNGINGMLQLLMDDGLTPTQHRMADRAVRSAQALTTVLNDVLDFSRLEEGQFVLHPEYYDPVQLMREVVDLMMPLADEKALSLRLETTVDGGAALHAAGDPMRVRQVLTNLLSNALKFTEKGGVRLCLAVQDDGRPLPTLVFSVTDTGIGIPEERRPTLFTRFSQGDSSITRRFGGSGLGLAISHRLVTLMGGDIEVESAVGEGTTFTVRLPAMAHAAAAAAEAAETAGVSLEVLQGAPLLLVEDNRVNSEIAQAVLTRAGAEVTTASDGVDGVARAREAPFALILMDVSMAGMDGLEATQLIRGGDGPNRDTPILALTANVLPDDEIRFQEAGMSGVLGKPFTFEALLETASRFVAQGSREDAAAADPDRRTDASLGPAA